MHFFLKSLQTKEEVDDVIRNTEDKVLTNWTYNGKVVVLRFGRKQDLVCMQQDDIVFCNEIIFSWL